MHDEEWILSTLSWFQLRYKFKKCKNFSEISDDAGEGKLRDGSAHSPIRNLRASGAADMTFKLVTSDRLDHDSRGSAGKVRLHYAPKKVADSMRRCAEHALVKCVGYLQPDELVFRDPNDPDELETAENDDAVPMGFRVRDHRNVYKDVHSKPVVA